ncbi:MAG: prepilin peptidase [Patescibacteria group bacterium]
MQTVLVAILGLVVGSFLNVVIYRLHAGVNFVRGRSYCPHCKHDLSAADLVPLFSFIFLRGRCRYCRKSISWQYPLVELGTSLAFLALFCRFGLTPEFFVYLVYAALLVAVFVYDLRYYLILDRVSLPAAVIGFVFSLTILHISAVHLLIGGAIGAGFFLLQFVVSRGRWIGGGDIRLGLAMGFMLGYPHVLVALFVAYVLGSLVGIGLILAGGKTWQSKVPFGTFLTAATLLTFLFGEQVVSYYRTLFAL